MESTFMNFTVDNDTEINAHTLGTDDSCLNTAVGTIPEEPDIIGFIPLSGKNRPKVVPTNKITAFVPCGPVSIEVNAAMQCSGRRYG